jgi:uncharacterized protein (DUF983 family)
MLDEPEDDWAADDWGDDLDDDGEEVVTIACPACGEAMYDDAPQCPACGHYLTDDDLQHESKPLWIMLTAIICLALAVGWALGGW